MRGARNLQSARHSQLSLVVRRQCSVARPADSLSPACLLWQACARLAQILMLAHVRPRNETTRSQSARSLALRSRIDWLALEGVCMRSCVYVYAVEQNRTGELEFVCINTEIALVIVPAGRHCRSASQSAPSSCLCPYLLLHIYI